MSGGRLNASRDRGPLHWSFHRRVTCLQIPPGAINDSSVAACLRAMGGLQRCRCFRQVQRRLQGAKVGASDKCFGVLGISIRTAKSLPSAKPRTRAQRPAKETPISWSPLLAAAISSRPRLFLRRGEIESSRPPRASWKNGRGMSDPGGQGHGRPPIAA